MNFVLKILIFLYDLVSILESVRCIDILLSSTAVWCCIMSYTALGVTGHILSRGDLSIYSAGGMHVVVHREGGVLVVLWCTIKALSRILGSFMFDEGLF